MVAVELEQTKRPPLLSRLGAAPPKKIKQRIPILTLQLIARDNKKPPQAGGFYQRFTGHSWPVNIPCAWYSNNKGFLCHSRFDYRLF
jgi:hypothetical protein